MFGKVNFREDGKKKKKNVFGVCLVERGKGKKMVKSGYFLPRPTKKLGREKFKDK